MLFFKHLQTYLCTPFIVIYHPDSFLWYLVSGSSSFGEESVSPRAHNRGLSK